MVRRTIKRRLGDILREVYTELNFPSEVIIVCSVKSTGRLLPLAALFFVFDELATLYDALGNVGNRIHATITLQPRQKVAPFLR
jgi:hypothetical protein